MDNYNAFNVYRRELAHGTVSLTGDRAQGDDSKHWAYSNRREKVYVLIVRSNICENRCKQKFKLIPILYGDLVYKFKRIVGKPYLSVKFKKDRQCFIKAGYSLDVM